MIPLTLALSLQGRGCRMNIILIPLIILSAQGNRISLNNQPKRG
jgi:hypothetical protein